MSLTILKPSQKGQEWSFENGKEVLWYDENPLTREVIITAPAVPQRPGFNRHKTTQAKEMDRVFRKVSEQEHEKNAEVIEKLWNRGRDYYDACRSRLTQRMLSADCKEWEKSFIKEALKRMEIREFEASQNNVYGVSSMEESSAPLPGPSTRISVKEATDE